MGIICIVTYILHNVKYKIFNKHIYIVHYTAGVHHRVHDLWVAAAVP